MCDTGTSVSFISNKFFQTLRIKLVPMLIEFKGLAASNLQALGSIKIAVTLLDRSSTLTFMVC